MMGTPYPITPQDELVHLLVRGEKPPRDLLESTGADLVIVKEILAEVAKHLDYLRGYSRFTSFFHRDEHKQWLGDHVPKARDYQQVHHVFRSWLYGPRDRPVGLQVNLYLTRTGYLVASLYTSKPTPYVLSPLMGAEETIEWIRRQADERNLQIDQSLVPGVAQGLRNILSTSVSEKRKDLERQDASLTRVDGILARIA